MTDTQSVCLASFKMDLLEWSHQIFLINSLLLNCASTFALICHPLSTINSDFNHSMKALRTFISLSKHLKGKYSKGMSLKDKNVGFFPDY